MKTVIVTGAAGFLGSYLSEFYLNKGFNVIGLDNFYSGFEKNVEYLKALSKNFHFINADVSKDWSLWSSKVDASLLKDIKFVFHFASPASPPIYQRLAFETIWVNSIGTHLALEFATKHKAKVIFASTSEIYGDPEFSPQPESYWGNVNSFGERSCYDEAKRMGETLIFTFNKLHNTRHGFVRIFNTYGPRMNPTDGRVVINFLVQGLQGKDLTVYGDGKQTRSFCFVEDLIAGITTYAENDLIIPVNIGNPNEFTILELAQMVQEIFKEKNLKIIHESLPSDDPKQRRPDITRAKEMLSPWTPKIQLKDGLPKMIEWLRTVGY